MPCFPWLSRLRTLIAAQGREARALIVTSLLTASCALWGLATFSLSMSPSALRAVYGVRGAPLTLGSLLILHTAALVVLVAVFYCDREICAFQPTPWSRKSKVPVVLAVGFLVTCCAIGSALLTDWTDLYDSASRDSNMDSDSGNNAGPDGLILLLMFIFLTDAVILLEASFVQATGVPRRFLQPMCKLRDWPLAPVLLVFFAAIALALTGACAYAASVPWAYQQLWKFRVPAVVAELVFGSHSAFAALAAAQLWDSIRQGTDSGLRPIAFFFSRPSDATERLAFSGALAIGVLTTTTAFALTAVTSSYVGAGIAGRCAYEVLAVTLLALAFWGAPMGHVRAAREGIVRSLGSELMTPFACSQPIVGSSVLTRGPFACLQSSAQIRAQLLVVVTSFSASTVCYMYVVAGSDAISMQQTGAFAPPAYIAVLGIGFMLLIHVPGLGIFASVCYEGNAIAGLAVPKTLPAVSRRRLGAGFLVATCLLCAAALLCIFFGLVVVDLESDLEVLLGDMGPEPDLNDAETCQLYFGVDEKLADADQHNPAKCLLYLDTLPTCIPGT